MKAMALLAVLMVCALGLTGCATSYPVGNFYTQLTLPVDVGDGAVKATKVGTAECTSIMALVATGDASIEAAMRNGGITKVHHVDWQVENVLGIIGKYKVVVYGE